MLQTITVLNIALSKVEHFNMHSVRLPYDNRYNGYRTPWDNIIHNDIADIHKDTQGISL